MYPDARTFLISLPQKTSWLATQTLDVCAENNVVEYSKQSLSPETHRSPSTHVSSPTSSFPDPHPTYMVLLLPLLSPRTRAGVALVWRYIRQDPSWRLNPDENRGRAVLIGAPLAAGRPNLQHSYRDSIAVPVGRRLCPPRALNRRDRERWRCRLGIGGNGFRTLVNLGQVVDAVVVEIPGLRAVFKLLLLGNRLRRDNLGETLQARSLQPCPLLV